MGEREPSDYWLEVRHNPNDTYLSNKTSAINQTIRSTTAVLSGTLTYHPPTTDPNTSEETTSPKNVLKLEDISLISTASQTRTTTQSIVLPWMNSRPNTTQRSPNRNNNRTRGPPTPKRPRTTLAQMSPTTTSPDQNLSVALQANPIPSSLIPSDPILENPTPTHPPTDPPTDQQSS